jgi:hypothetical protein
MFGMASNPETLAFAGREYPNARRFGKSRVFNPAALVSAFIA